MSNPGRRDGSRRPQGREQGVHGVRDPFGAFSGRSLFQDFFGEDPFNDPFFTQPLGGMFGSRSGLGPPGGLFGPSLFGGGLFGQQEPHCGFLEQRPYNQQPEARRGPVIEEVTGNHDHLPHSRSSEQPIVEHPDDEVRVERHASHSQCRARNPIPGLSSSGLRNDLNPRSFSYQSAAVTYGGSDGPYYSSYMRRRAGPNGVVEEEVGEKDWSGKEEERHSRGLGNKGRSSTRKRNADGREEKFETLHNLKEEEAGKFDRDWERHASAGFPDWKARSRASSLVGNEAGSSSRGGSALPMGSSGGCPSTWCGAKQARVELQVWPVPVPVQKGGEVAEGDVVRTI